MHFAYEAIAQDGRTITERIEAGDRSEAVESLREKGLMVVRLDEHDDAPANGPSAKLSFHRSSVTIRDRILFSRQMKMLLESGSPLVPALTAAEEQTEKPAVRSIIQRVRQHVEEGGSLVEALESEDDFCDAVFRTMIGAGEATATLPQVFDRLSGLAQQQMQTRKLVVGAMIYPMVLCCLLTGVVSMLLFFVVPRFKGLFASLDSPLPATTKILFVASQYIKEGWPYVLAGLAAVITSVVLCIRLPSTRAWLDEVVLRLPVVGRLMSRLIFARVVRVWAAMLRCHVPLLETIRQSREAVRNSAFLRLIDKVEESVSSGGRMGHAVAAARLADPIIVSALTTGEDNGRLAEAADFVSGWMDEDNLSAIQQATRLMEPLLLTMMGIVVGFVAMALFVPLFDLATAAG